MRMKKYMTRMGQKTGTSKTGMHDAMIEKVTALVAEYLPPRHACQSQARTRAGESASAPELELWQPADEGAELAVVDVALTRGEPRCALFCVRLCEVGLERRVEFGRQEGEEEVEEVDAARRGGSVSSAE